jgi:hypothetical protein
MRSKKASVQTNLTPQNEIDEAIVEACEEIQTLLLQKNYQYNNSLHAEPPLFTDIDPIAGIKARINDKMNRIKQTGLTSDTEDTLDDLIGYLIHLRIAYKLKTY